jgi:hypothetical protein
VTKGSFTNTEAALLEGVRVFPNPVQDELNLSLPAGTILEQARLYHANGQLLGQWAGAVRQLEVGQWPNGAYTVELQTNYGVVRRLVVKQ